MPTITHRQLHADLDHVLARAERGESFEITMEGRPVARLTGIGRDRRCLPAEDFVRPSNLGPDPMFFDDVSSGIDHAVRDPFSGRP